MEPALLDRLKGSNVFYASELNKLFEEWFNDQLCTGIFPQYNGFALSAKPPSGGTGTAVAELNAMIGLAEAKAVLRQVLDYHLVKQIFKDRNIPQDFPCAHMVFTGNPGTAKTTAARLFARALKENGILPTGHLVEVGRSDLVGQYVGWTAVQVKKKFEDAKGGVLFIDEAYSLTDDRDGSFGDEAINTIVQEMENHRHEMIVILAGYPDRMETFLDKNPGLRSRIAFHVPFKDYSEEELCDISRMIAEKQGCILSDTFTDRLPDLFRVAKGAPDFGNGRYVRNLLEQAKMNHATRILQMDRAAVTETALRTLSAEDLPAPQPPRAVPVRKIGFGV